MSKATIHQYVSPVAGDDWISLHHVANASGPPSGPGAMDAWRQKCIDDGIEIRDVHGRWPLVHRSSVEKLIGPQKAKSILMGNLPEWLRLGPLSGTLGISHHMAGFVARVRGATTREGGAGLEALASDVVILKRNLDRERNLKTLDDDWVPVDGILELLRRATAHYLITLDENETDVHGNRRVQPNAELIHRCSLLGIRWRSAVTRAWEPKRIAVNAFDLYRLAGVDVDPERTKDFKDRMDFAAGSDPIPE